MHIGREITDQDVRHACILLSPRLKCKAAATQGGEITDGQDVCDGGPFHLVDDDESEFVDDTSPFDGELVVLASLASPCSFSSFASPRRNAKMSFGPLGVADIRTFANPQNPTHGAVFMDVADLDALMAAMGNEATAEAVSEQLAVLC